MDDMPWGFVNLKVIKDEADADPMRRYKMTTHVYFHDASINSDDKNANHELFLNAFTY